MKAARTLVLMSLVLICAYGVAEAPAPVPRSLGTGTGGDGAWSVGHAVHSPSTVAIDPSAGPAETPAAVLGFTFAPRKYNWSWASVGLGSVDPAWASALRVTYRSETGPGSFRLNLMVREAGGAAYWVAKGLPLSPGEFTTVTVPLGDLTPPTWSPKDPTGKLEAEQIRQVSLGLETAASGRGRLFIADLQLVPPGW